MNKPLRKPVRIITIYPAELVEQVKRFQHANEIDTRSEAFRRLVETGLKAEGREEDLATRIPRL